MEIHFMKFSSSFFFAISQRMLSRYPRLVSSILVFFIKMGNRLYEQQRNLPLISLNGTVRVALRLFTNCKRQEGRKMEILRLYQRFHQINPRKDIFGEPPVIKNVFRNSLCEGLEDAILCHFSKNRNGRVNFLELMCGMITYANMT